MEIFELLMKALLEHGAIGLLAAIGWGVAAFMGYREFKKRDTVSPDVVSRDATIKEREITIKEKSDEISQLHQKMLDRSETAANERITDIKELNEEYNDVIKGVQHTLEKLSIALHVKTSD